MWLLETANALFLCVAASDLSDLPEPQGDWASLETWANIYRHRKRMFQLGGLLVFANVCESGHVSDYIPGPATSIGSLVSSASHGIGDVIVAIVSTLLGGGVGVLVFLVGFLVWLWVYGRTIGIGHNTDTCVGFANPNVRFACVTTAISFSTTMVCYFLNWEKLFHPAFQIECVKALVCLFIFQAVCYLDVQRHRPNHKLAPSFFIRTWSSSFAMVVPGMPIAAVVISTGFLILVSLFEFLHIDTAVLSKPIYYGTLYGPFSVVYIHAKRTLLNDWSHKIEMDGSGTPDDLTAHYKRRRLSTLDPIHAV